jgi:hypothetical protein
METEKLQHSSLDSLSRVMTVGIENRRLAPVIN